MLWVQQDGLNYLQFPELVGIPGLFHGIMTRFSKSDEKKQSFNLGLNCGDPPEKIWANRYRMLNAFGAAFGVFARQVHGTDVAVWPQAAAGGSYGRRSVYLKGDALATAAGENALVIQTADCQSIMMADPIRRVAANVHSGWRGSIANVIAETIAVMVSRWGCRPQDIMCGIGPSLGPCCAEFVNYRKEIPSRYWHYQRSECHFDFWQISIDQLMAAGVCPHHIEVSYLCTRCNQHLFFSYRGNKQSGRFATLIGWSSLIQDQDGSEKIC